MKDFFWVLPNADETWFQVRTTNTWVCLSATSTWDDVLRCLETLVKRYKSETVLREKLNNMEYGSRISEIEKESLRELYPLYKDYRQDEIQEVISRAMTEVIEEQRRNKPFKKVLSRLNKSKKVIDTVETYEEQEVPKSPVKGIKLPKIRKVRV